MKYPIVGPSSQMAAASYDNQRTVNFFPVKSESGGSKEQFSLMPCPGLQILGTAAGGGPGRAAFSSASGRLFAVCGNAFYEISSAGVATSRGTLNSSTGRCSIAENPTQIMIVDGTDGYIFTKASNAFAEITDGDFPGGDTVTYIDGYFIVNKPDTGQFYISALNDGTSWGALDFATAESNPDNIVGIIEHQGDLWIFGQKSVDVYENTGDVDFPFSWIAGFKAGCTAAHTIMPFDNSLVWLGEDEYGRGMVQRADGYRPQRVSKHAIERLIDSVDEDISLSYAWVYQNQGHEFYMLQIFGLDRTLCLDASIMEWHERMYWNTKTGLEEQHRGACHAFFAQNNIVFDRETGQFYKMRLDVYSDNGDAIRRIRRFPGINGEGKRVFYSDLTIDMEVGVGLSSGQGSDPVLTMRYSNDNGKTWATERTTGIGALGEYNTQVSFNQLGSTYKHRIFEIEVSDPVFVQINGGYGDAFIGSA